MKFLLIGDFHGKIHKKLNKIKNLDFDYILCTGDLSFDGGLRKYVFRYWKELDKKPLEKIIGKKEYHRICKKIEGSKLIPLKFLNSLGKKAYLVRGNFDLEPTSKNKKESNLIIKPLAEKVKKYKNIHLINARVIKIKDYDLIIHSGYRFPTEKGIEKSTFVKYTQEGIKRRNKQWNRRLKKLFSKVKNFDNTIFLAHDPPKNYLDKVKNKKSPLYGKHIGDEYYTKYIKKYKPSICVCGHMHENQGKDKIGKTLVVNPGPALEGKFAILELKDNKIISIKFYK
ncbi:MAG: metallophosphoesterase [Nanoarchaeota archaeon]|nr:metallophosphoesterase [Nanoarchaeota archaeon]